MSIEQKRKDFAAALKSRFIEQDVKEIAKLEEAHHYIQDQEELLEAYSQKKPPSTDVLGVLRSSCSICPKQCERYEPFDVYLLELQDLSYSNTFVPTLCRNCKCPAYYHPPIPRDFKIPKELREGLRSTVLKEDHLNFSGVLAVFDINYKLLDEKRKSLKEQEDSLYLLLQNGGFSVVCRSVRIMSNEEKIFLGQNPAKTLNTNIFLQTLVNKTMQLPQFSRNTQPVLREKQEEPLLILCLSSMYANSQIKLSKFLVAAEKYLPVSIKSIYTSSNATQGFTDASIFFPEVFMVRRSCVIIPTEDFSKETLELDPLMSFFKLQSMRLKGKGADIGKDPNLMKLGKAIDLLHYNGYTCMDKAQTRVENYADLKEVLEKFMESGRAEHLSRFILANSKDFKINSIGTGKVGIPLVISLAAQSMESFTFTAEKEIFHLFSYFLPNLVMSSRTLLVFRPVIVRSGLDKLFLNVFKRNFFIVLQEEHRKLTVEEVHLLGKEAKIGNFEEFLEFMTEGECHIVAVSKLGCVEEAKTLAHGSRLGRRKTEKRLLYIRSLSIQHEAEKNPYKLLPTEEIGLEPHQARYIQENVHVSHSLGENSLFSLSPFSSISEALDLDSVVETQLKNLQHTLDLPNLYRKQKGIEKLRQFSRDFNIAMHTSDCHISAEQELLHFFPHLCLYSDVILILRHDALSLEQDALRLLTNMRAKVIKGCTANNQNYYHIVKLAGRVEFEAVFHYSTPIQEILKPQHLSSLFTICSFPSEFEENLAVISPEIKNLSLVDINIISHELFIEIAAYALLVTSNEDLAPDHIEFVANYPELLHYSFKAVTLQNTVKEIRVRKLRELPTQNNHLELLELFDEYSVISWYYKEISKNFPKIVPSFYEFKIEPMEESLPITRVFTCSEFKGHIFLKQVSENMKENRQREQNSKKSRGSMSAFMWGRKLALLAERIEQVQSDHIEDFGPIYWNGQGKFLGFYTNDYLTFDTQKYHMYLDQLSSGWGEYISSALASQILGKAHDILESEAFRISRGKANIGLVPHMVEFTNLRVFSYKEKPDISKIDYIDPKIAAMNELYGKNTLEIDMKDIAITDVFPAKYHKRHMAGNIMWLLDVYLSNHDVKEEELNMGMEEYMVMIRSLYDGFINNYTNDEGVRGISLLQMEYFLFSLSQAWHLVVTIIELQFKRDGLGMGSARVMSEINKIRQEEERITRNLVFQLEKLAKIDLEYVDRRADQEHFLIDRERYFKHYMLKEYEKDLNHPRYPNKLAQTKFPVINPLLEEYIKGSLSQLQMSWFTPNPALKINLRPVPKEAYRYDSIAVKHTKWMTHQRQQKLIKQAITFLTQSSLGGFIKTNK